MTETLEPQTRGPLANWGFWAILAGGIAMILFFVQMQVPSGSTQSVGQQIGEIAGDIRKSAWRSFLGLPQPQPEVVARSLGLRDIIQIAIPVLGVLAVLLSAVSLMSKENWRLAMIGIGLGTSAILFQYFMLMALMILGFLLLAAIVSNIGDIFGG